MSMIGKVPFHAHKNINEALESTWAMILSPGVINQVHVVYDSYLQNLIKESERAHRSDTTPIDVVDLGLESAIPVDLKSFWSSAGNKHQLQIASRKFFQNKSFLSKIDVILSGYITDAYGVYPGERIATGVVTEDPELSLSIEEADSRTIPDIAIACHEEIKRMGWLSCQAIPMLSSTVQCIIRDSTSLGSMGQVWNKRWAQKHSDSQARAATWWREVFSFTESLHSDWM